MFSGYVVEVQLLQHTLLHHPANHVVGGDDHVHGDAAVGQLGVHDLVGVIGGILHADVGVGFLKGGDYIQRAVVALGDVLTPVVDVQGGLFTAAAAGKTGQAAHGKQDGKDNGNPFFHDNSPLYPAVGSGSFFVPAELNEVHGDHQHQNQQE